MRDSIIADLGGHENLSTLERRQAMHAALDATILEDMQRSCWASAWLRSSSRRRVRQSERRGTPKPRAPMSAQTSTRSKRLSCMDAK